MLTISMMAATCMLINSCEKDQPECNGNCVTIRISGRVYDKRSGAGFKDVPLEVKWTSARIGSNRYKVAEGKTDNNGNFDFTKTIDSTFFKNYYLSVRIPRDTNYLSLPGSGGISTLEERFYSLDINGMQQINFEYFSKTDLKVRLHRTQNDVFSYFSLGAAFADNFGTGYYTIAGQQNAKDTTLLFETAANIYTKVLSGKKLNGVQISNRTDSIICTPNGANTITIDY